MGATPGNQSAADQPMGATLGSQSLRMASSSSPVPVVAVSARLKRWTAGTASLPETLSE